ncbi:MAG: metalloregulator ArsR/SmtB family transcription factor [Acidobacteria bacterium]|nr:metalloregulator ArsR/SmtB family transcription factor [Acidobacteriota bacterium]
MKSARENISWDRIELLKIMGHPLRVGILEILEHGPMNVTELGKILSASQPHISQQLGLLGRFGLIDYYIAGQQRFYFLVNPIVPDLLWLLRKQYKKKLDPPKLYPNARVGKSLGNGRH